MQSETSTGVVADVQAIAAAAKDAGALLVVDAVSTLGARAVRDGRMGPRRRRVRLPEGAHDAAGPGAAAVSEARSPRASRFPQLLPRLGATREAQRKLDAPFTPAVSLVVGLDVALGLLLENGLERRSSATSGSAARHAQA